VVAEADAARHAMTGLGPAAGPGPVAGASRPGPGRAGAAGDADAAGADAVFAALASPVRRRVLDTLRRRGPLPVNAIADEFAMRRPSVSEHLKVLLDAGLVVQAKHGRERRYTLVAEPLGEIASWLTPYEDFWRGRLRALGELLDGGVALGEVLDDETPGDESSLVRSRDVRSRDVPSGDARSSGVPPLGVPSRGGERS
jgi:DNA-binding transcriptional ArsR family regulator